MKEKLKHPIVILFLKFGLLYLGWFLIYDVWLRNPNEKLESEGQPNLEHSSSLDEWVVRQTSSATKIILESLGHEVFDDGNRTIGIVGSGGLWIGDSCNAITIIALFAGIIIIVSGIWWKKIIFILLGAISIWILNVFRMVFLAIINLESQALTEFNHTYTFTIIMYAYIIFLWYWWIKKYSDTPLIENEQKN